jgi:hypothetical protein
LKIEDICNNYNELEAMATGGELQNSLPNGIKWIQLVTERPELIRVCVFGGLATLDYIVEVCKHFEATTLFNTDLIIRDAYFQRAFTISRFGRNWKQHLWNDCAEQSLLKSVTSLAIGKWQEGSEAPSLRPVFFCLVCDLSITLNNGRQSLIPPFIRQTVFEWKHGERRRVLPGLFCWGHGDDFGQLW